MPIESLGQNDYQNFIDPTKETEETSQTSSTKVSEEQYADSVNKAEAQEMTYTMEANNPKLTPPNFDMAAAETQKGADANSLTGQQINEFLKDFPQIAQFLQGQETITEQDIHNFVVNKLLENPNSIYSAEALAGTAVAELMHNVLQVTNDPELKALWDNLRAQILTENNPMAEVLLSSMKQDNIDRGMSPKEAEAKAVGDLLQKLDVELSENGVVTPYYGTHPEMKGALSTLLTERLGGTDVSAQFVGQIETLLASEGGIIAAMNAMAAVSSGESVEDLMNGPMLQIDGSLQMINTAIAQVNSLPLPEGEKMAILAFMKQISEALAELKELMGLINLSDAERAGLEAAVTIEKAMGQMQSTIKKVRKLLDEIKKLERKRSKMGFLGKLGKIGSIAGFAAINALALALMVVITVVVVVALTVFLGPAGLLLGMLLAPVIFMAVGVLFLPVFALTSTSLALKEEGKLEEMMDGFFGFAMGMAEAFGMKDMAEDTIAYIGMGVLAAGVILPVAILVIVPVVAIGLLVLLAPLMIVLLPLLLVIVLVALPLVSPLLVLGSLAFGAVAMLLVSAVVLSLMALPLTLAMGTAFLPDLVFRSGALGHIAGWIGQQAGLSEDETLELEMGFRMTLGMASAMGGFQQSERIDELSAEEQAEIEKRGGAENDALEAGQNQGLLSGMKGYTQPVHFLLERMALAETSPEAMEKKQEELKAMMALLRKLIQQLEKLMIAIMGGGDPAAITEAIAGFKEFVQTEIGHHVDPGDPEQVQAQQQVNPFLDAMTEVIPNVLPSPDAIRSQLKALQEEDFIDEDDEEMIRTSELMG